MPIDLRISHSGSLVIATARGTLDASDVDLVFLKQREENALSYGKLFDIRGARVLLSESDLMMHAGRLSAYGHDEIGPVALLVDEGTETDSPALASLATARRPFKIFKSQGEALTWLHSRQPK